MKTLYITAISILLVLLLTACAPTMWVKPGETQASFNRDMFQCRQLGVQEAMLGGLQGNPFAEIAIQNSIKRCLSSMGWTVQAQGK